MRILRTLETRFWRQATKEDKSSSTYIVKITELFGIRELSEIETSFSSSLYFVDNDACKTERVKKGKR